MELLWRSLREEDLEPPSLRACTCKAPLSIQAAGSYPGILVNF
jgi:hypothetical protein